MTPVNDPPTVTILPITVGEDGVATGTVIAEDVDEGDTLSYEVTTPPARKRKNREPRRRSRTRPTAIRRGGR